MPVAPKGRRTVAERVGRSKYTQITFAENQKHRVAPKGRRRSRSESGEANIPKSHSLKIENARRPEGTAHGREASREKQLLGKTIRSPSPPGQQPGPPAHMRCKQTVGIRAPQTIFTHSRFLRTHATRPAERYVRLRSTKIESPRTPSRQHLLCTKPHRTRTGILRIRTGCGKNPLRTPHIRQAGRCPHPDRPSQAISRNLPTGFRVSR